MARQLQLRRGTTEESTSFIGALGEVTVDTSNYKLRVHDGMTPGGHIVGEHTVVVNTDDLFDWKWSDHRLSEDQDKWVCADDYEWIYADDYPDAYQHLVNEYQTPDWTVAVQNTNLSEDESWFRVTWDGSKFVALNSRGYISTSTDGTTWTTATQVTELGSQGWYSFTWNENKFVAVGYTGYISTSTDGTTWTTATQNLEPRDWYGIAWNGTKFVAIGERGYISTSTDGTTWTTATQVTELGNHTWNGIAWDGTKFVAIGLGGYISTSTDGTTWTTATQNSRLGTHGWRDIIWTGTKFVAIGVDGYISTSTDGTTWAFGVQNANLGANTWRAIAWNGQKLIALGQLGHVSEKIDYQQETIANITVQFWLAEDGHRICPLAQESNITSIYTTTGVAWYYLLDKTNQRFKLPRTKWGVVGLRDQVEGYVAQDVKLPNITGNLTVAKAGEGIDSKSGVFTNSYTGGQEYSSHSSTTTQSNLNINFNASNSSSVYSGDGSDTLIQPRATQMYLYFCLKPMETEISPSEGSDVCKAIENQNNALGSEPILYNWEGTLQEYLDQDVEHLHPEWVCYITDDVVDTTQNPAYYVHRIGDEIIQGYKTFINTIYAEGGIQGTSSSAKWADLAERYQSDSRYPIGTLVKFGGEKDITIADKECHAIISDKPGFILDSELDDSLPIALSGKTPVRVLGKVNKFDKLVLSNEPGVAKVQETSSETVIAIALESSLIEEEKLVLSVVKLTF